MREKDSSFISQIGDCTIQRVSDITVCTFSKSGSAYGPQNSSFLFCMYCCKDFLSSIEVIV